VSPPFLRPAFFKFLVCSKAGAGMGGGTKRTLQTRGEWLQGEPFPILPASDLRAYAWERDLVTAQFR